MPSLNHISTILFLRSCATFDSFILLRALSCAKPERLQSICDGLSAEKIDGFLRKWLRLLPHPFTGNDRKAGYRYDCQSYRLSSR